MHIFVFLCMQMGNRTGTNFLISQGCYHLLYGTVYYAKLRCDLLNNHSLVLTDECMNFMLVAFGCGTSQPTTTWLISDVRVSVFEVFHPPSDTASAHAGIFVHLTQPAVDICS